MLKLLSKDIDLGLVGELRVRQGPLYPWYLINPNDPISEDFFVPREGEALLTGLSISLVDIERVVGYSLKGSTGLALNAALTRTFVIADLSMLLVESLQDIYVRELLERGQWSRYVEALLVSYKLLDDRGGVLDAIDQTL